MTSSATEPPPLGDEALRWGGAREASAAAGYFDSSSGTTTAKLAAFPRFVDRTSIARFLVKADMFRQVLPVQGSIIECGVHDGGGLFTFAHLSAIYEPLNHRRRIVGFDTFEGFPSVHDVDRASGSEHAFVGNYSGAPVAELQPGIDQFDRGRALGSIPKIELVPGDFLATGPEYIKLNPHVLVSLLYMDFDLYEPTRLALELFLPRMPAGAVVAFDEAHSSEFPGETLALMESLDLPSLHLTRSPFTSICWASLRGGERSERHRGPSPASW